MLEGSEDEVVLGFERFLYRLAVKIGLVVLKELLVVLVDYGALPISPLFVDIYSIIVEQIALCEYLHHFELEFLVYLDQALLLLLAIQEPEKSFVVYFVQVLEGELVFHSLDDLAEVVEDEVLLALHDRVSDYDERFVLLGKRAIGPELIQVFKPLGLVKDLLIQLDVALRLVDLDEEVLQDDQIGLQEVLDKGRRFQVHVLLSIELSHEV